MHLLYRGLIFRFCRASAKPGRLASLLLLLLLVSPAFAQTDPTPSAVSPELAAATDTSEQSIEGIKFIPFREWSSPAKAAFYSAIFPGMGQLYNRKYWKIPIVYAASGITAYYIFRNNRLYREFQQNYSYEIDDDPTTINTTSYNSQTLQRGVLLYHRYRDLSVLLFIAAHGLNVLDAHVDAHLKEFDISEDLSFKLKPQLMVGPANALYPAITFKLNLKP